MLFNQIGAGPQKAKYQYMAFLDDTNITIVGKVVALARKLDDAVIVDVVARRDEIIVAIHSNNLAVESMILAYSK